MTAAEVIVFPDAKQAAIIYLRAQLTARSDTAKVGDALPKPIGRFVDVQRHGPGARRQVVIEDATLVVTCWDAKAEEATDLAALCRALLELLPTRGAGNVITVKEAELDDQRDPLSDSPFSSFAITLAMRGAAA